MVIPLGNDDQTWIVGMDSRIGTTIAGPIDIAGMEGGIGNALVGSLEIAMVEPKGAKVTVDNVVGVEMEDLSENDREEIEKELQREMEEVMVERRKKKLTCF
jgi:hypothetical protein